MSFLSANPVGSIIAGVIVVLFMAGLLFLMNHLARRKQKKNGMDGRSQEYRIEGDSARQESPPSSDASSSAEDSCQGKLRRLREMYEEGLITAEEYEREKAACLERFREQGR